MAVSLLTIMIIAFGAFTGIFNSTMRGLNTHNSKVEASNNIQLSTTPLTGCDVILAIKNNASTTFTVTVKTKSGSKINYNSQSSYKITDSTNNNYINSYAQFNQVINQSSNNTIVGVTYTEI